MKITPVFGDQTLFNPYNENIVAMRFMKDSGTISPLTINELRNIQIEIAKNPIVALRLVEEDEPPVFKPESMSTVVVQNKKYTFYGYTDLGAVVLKNEITQEIVYADPALMQPYHAKKAQLDLSILLHEFMHRLENIEYAEDEFKRAVKKAKSDIAELLKWNQL